MRVRVYVHLSWFYNNDWKPPNIFHLHSKIQQSTFQTLSLYHVWTVYLFIYFFLASYRLPVHTCQWLWFPWQCVWKHNVGTRQNWLGGDHFGWGHMRRLAHSGYHSPWLKHVFKSRKSPRRFIMASGVMFFSGCRSSANLWCIDLIINALNLINFNDYQNTQCVTRAASDISQLYHCNSEINSLNEALNW